MNAWRTDQWVCATCVHWKGNRVFLGGTLYQTEDKKGKCGGPFGSPSPSETSEGLTCDFWAAVLPAFAPYLSAGGQETRPPDEIYKDTLVCWHGCRSGVLRF